MAFLGLHPCPNPLSDVNEPNDPRLINTAKRATLVHLTEGFYAGNWRHDQLTPEFGGIVRGSTDDIDVIEAADLAISFVNNSLGTNLELVEVVRANFRLCSDKMYYLTIKASDNIFYETEVYVNIRDKISDVHFIRLAVHYPQINPAFLKFDAPDHADAEE